MGNAYRFSTSDFILARLDGVVRLDGRAICILASAGHDGLIFCEGDVVFVSRGFQRGFGVSSSCC